MANLLSRAYTTYKDKITTIINSKIYAMVNIVILIFSAISLSNGNVKSENKFLNIIFFELDKMYSVFFLIDCIINLSITPIKKTLTTFWGLFNVTVGIISYCSLYNLPNFTSIRLWLIIKYLPKIPGLQYVETICLALSNSLPILKDIGIFTGFFFTSVGLISVAFLGGRLSYRCVNDEGKIFNEELICSPSSNQCPKGYTCQDVHINPDKGTISFDNVLISFLNIFQILTTEGWSNIYFTVSSVTNKIVIVFFILIIIIGNWLILQLIVATVVSNLQNSITIHKTYNFKMKKTFISNIDSTDKNQQLRKKLEVFINKQWVENIILCITIIDTIFICMVSNEISEATREKIFYMSLVCTIIFILEMIIKIYVLGLRGYITSSFYNVTDGIFTLISIGELLAQSDNGIAVFRVLRTFRVLRLTKFLPQLSNLISVFCDSAKPLVSLFTIWGLSIIGFSLFAVQFFEGGMNFSNNKPQNNFENFFYSFLSVIQLYTVENWDSIKTNVAESKNIYATIIPVIIIIIGAYIFSQFLVAILLNSIIDRIKNNYNFQELNKDKRDAKHIIKYVLNELFDARFDPEEDAIFTQRNRIEGPSYTALATDSDIEEDENKMEKLKKEEEENKEDLINNTSLIQALKRNHTYVSNEQKEQEDKNEDYTTDIPLKTINKGKSIDSHSSNKNNQIYNSNMTIPDLDDNISSYGSGENLINNYEDYIPIDMEKINSNDDIIKNDNSNDAISKKTSKHRVKNLISHNISKLKEKYPGLNEQASKKINFPTVFSNNIERSKTRTEMIKAKKISKRQNSERSFNKKENININHFDKNMIIDDESSDCSNPKSDSLNKNEYSQDKNKAINLAKIDENAEHNNEIFIDNSSIGYLKKIYRNYRDSYLVHLCYKLSINQIYFIILNIVTILSCISIVFESPKLKESKHYNLILMEDILFAAFYSFDIVLKFIANGVIFSKQAYLKKFKCWIDIFTVFISIINVTKYRDDFHSIRLLQLCYIMRFIYMQNGLRIVTIAIWKTIPSIFIAFIPYAFYLLICSLIGISLFVDKGWECSDTTILEHDKCVGNYTDRFDNVVERHWVPYSVTYDNFFDGLLSTFVVSHQEAWPDIMYRYINLSSDDTVRPEKIHLGYSIFFVGAILIGNWLFLSVITAVTFSSLKKNQDILSGIQYLTNGQRKILDYLKILITNSPKLSKVESIKEENRRILNLVKSNFFNKIMLTIICINIVFMMLMSYNINHTLKIFLFLSEIVFTLIYIGELILLYKAYGIKDFFKDFWNVLSLIIVVTSIISIVFESIIPTTLLVLIRVIRIIRIFQYSRGIKALGMAVMFNFTQLINVLVLMFLTCFVYAIIGYTYFGDIKIEHTNYLNKDVNFSSFGRSLQTVFIFSTGEGWPFGMADCMGKTITNCDPKIENCGSKYASIYYITLHIILNWILLNSFSAITVDTFITVLKEHDEIARLEKVWDKFNEQWIEYDDNKSGEVEFIDLISIYENFDLPKGIQWGNHERANGLLATKPPIEDLFKNIKIKNNKCNYNNVIFSFLNCWMGEELPESYIKKEKIIPKTGYEKKVIMRSKEKISSSSKNLSEKLKSKDISNASFYFNDDNDNQDNGTSSQFNPIIRHRYSSDKDTNDNSINNINILTVSSPSEMTLESEEDEEKTIGLKDTSFNDEINNNQNDEFVFFEDENNSDYDSEFNYKNENYYSFSSISSDEFNIKPNKKFERMNSNRAYVFDNFHSEKNKKFKIPLKETFSETFFKGKYMLISKNKYSSHEKISSVDNEEIPFSVVYNIYKLQHKFKNNKNRQYEDEIIIQ
ncbi:hypothetical protein BCR36DRAFT_408104 [Piromyces finnis]|uniref:Ion transport domain-containing protein n=1 Tax=Piromyces finnis TaxID=1754191 RepID=A0A1Y1VNZ0_9FUNG|nr:hypothetical protein BCR36DRAFT_408104 [Piromyces finnis]|eukprot:ORX61128.1 hypothetical protein BCR36DRAFT_408104 [Piromyces finnis]